MRELPMNCLFWCAGDAAYKNLARNGKPGMIVISNSNGETVPGLHLVHIQDDVPVSWADSQPFYVYELHKPRYPDDIYCANSGLSLSCKFLPVPMGGKV